MNYLNTKSLSIFIGLLIAGWLPGCATNSALKDQAQTDYTQAAGDPEIMKNAPNHMAEAQKYLAKADDTGDDEEADHYAYLAKKHVEIARSESARKASEEEMTNMQKGRDKIIVKARTQEADEAALAAKIAQDKAKQAEEKAKGADERAARSEMRADAAVNELQTLKTTQTKRGLQMTVPGALFETGKADLKAGAKLSLEKLVTTLKTNPNRQALVEGHTDSMGSDEYNLNLSRNRAQSVATFLEQNGIESSRIVARGYGESYPVASNKTDAGRLQNRRVDVILLNEGQKAENAGPDHTN